MLFKRTILDLNYNLIAAVGVRGIRDEIRATLGALGWSEGVHFTCAA